eukprot:9659167-Heterocapsa_arctica.AAC.1
MKGLLLEGLITRHVCNIGFQVHPVRDDKRAHTAKCKGVYKEVSTVGLMNMWLDCYIQRWLPTPR